MTSSEAPEITRKRRPQPTLPKPLELTPVLRRKMRTTTAAERIRWAREQLGGVSQEAFAELIGSSRRHVIRLEKGRGNGDGTNPDPRTRRRLAEVTRLPEEFFTDEKTRR